MDNLFLLLFFISIISLVAGLIKPTIFSKFLKDRATRKGVAKIFGIAAIVFFILFGMTTGKNTSPVENKSKVPAQQTKQEINKGPYSVLEISDVSVDNNKVTISGNTDLPTDSVLFVGFDVWGRKGSDLYIGVDKKTTVSNGKFNVSLDIPQRDEFKKAPYEISVLFTPRGQNQNVLALVGKNGEKLEGNLVKNSGTFKTMELVEKKDLNLTITPPSYPFQQLSEFSQGSAEHTLAEYILAWKNQDWNKMVSLSQKTWVSNEPNPASTLKAWYDFKTLKGFEIKNTKTISDTTKDITFIVYYEAVTNQIDKKQITARVIKETAPYTPSVQGQWGVNPTSTLREEDVN